MKIQIDDELCTGCEVCTEMCPAVFAMDDEGACAYAIEDEPPKSEEAACRKAADACPSGAISIQR